MIQELPKRSYLLAPLRYKRYFESKNKQVRVFGQCEVTGKHFEVFVPVEGFFIYMQGFKSLVDAFASSTAEDREFILNGVSPEGTKIQEQRS